MPPSLWSVARLSRIAVATSIALFLALFAHLFFFPYPISMLNAGDFPGFYVQAILIKKGLLHDLYNFELQRKIETDLWPTFNGMYYPSAYPPFTALLLYPLSFFEHQTAQNIFLFGMLMFYGASFYQLRCINNSIQNRTFSIAVILLLFPPIFSSLFGAQNSALSLFLATLSIKNLLKRTPQGSILAGVLIAIWFVKPQYGALFLLGTLCIQPDIWLLLGSVTTLACIWLFTAWFFGASWISWWMNQISFFDALNLSVNSKEAISLRGFVTALGGDYLSGWIITITSLLILCVSLLMGGKKNIPTKKLYGFLLASMPLISPQTLFYDLSIGLFGYLLVANFQRDKPVWILWILITLGAISFILRESTIPVPFFPLAVLLFSLVFCEVFSQQRSIPS